MTVFYSSWGNFLLFAFCILSHVWRRASLHSLARLPHQTSFHLIILTASCGPILMSNTPFCSEFNVCSFYIGIKNTNLGSIFGPVPLKNENVNVVEIIYTSKIGSITLLLDIFKKLNYCVFSNWSAFKVFVFYMEASTHCFISSFQKDSRRQCLPSQPSCQLLQYMCALCTPWAVHRVVYLLEFSGLAKITRSSKPKVECTSCYANTALKLFPYATWTKTFQ